ncbi:MULTISPECIES: hypothetical protein [Pseudomonas]|uniref:hypothetical protein n=1 Tax=Pseudomonas TaxID=286 RepID=UPI001183A408|nr:hypothetical protein [Pseudomonas sp. BJP69]QDR68472.1 hypothetical protein FPB55_12875 [Pseudomonas sp. BJP69]WHL27067.1 hypothetical protein QJS63_21150 [Pseudomonas juntendi]
MSELPKQVAPHDLPLCPDRLIAAIEAVRGSGFALQLLREHLRLRASAKLVFSEYADCYFLQLDDVDRYQNSRVGMLDAMSTMPFRSSEIFRQEISTWTPADLARVVDTHGLKALAELGLVFPAA